MSVRVLVTREFECVTVAEAAEQFKSLSEAGWSVLVDASSASPSGDAKPVEILIADIIRLSGADASAVAEAVGVCRTTVDYWSSGRHYPGGASLEKLRALHERVKGGSRELKSLKDRRKKREQRPLSQDDMLDISIRLSSGESVYRVATLYEITRERAKSIARKVGA